MLLQIDLLGLDQKDLESYQMMVRIVIVFISALASIRIAGIRTFGTKTAMDVVVSITLGALLARCITGHYPFFPTLAASAFLALFHRFCAWIAYKNKFFGMVMDGQAVILFKDGKKQESNLARNCISMRDLTKALHENSINDFEKVREMWLEPDGNISVVKKES